MGKQRQRIISSNITYKQCLSASELLKVEAESLTKMMTLRWPRPLALWRQKVSEAATQAKNQGLLNTHVWFKARDPRANATHFIELGGSNHAESTGDLFLCSRATGRIVEARGAPKSALRS